MSPVVHTSNIYARPVALPALPAPTSLINNSAATRQPSSKERGAHCHLITGLLLHDWASGWVSVIKSQLGHAGSSFNWNWNSLETQHRQTKLFFITHQLGLKL